MFKDGRHEASRLEDEYFYKKDRELIDKMHEEEARKQELLARTSHYHKCACCGHGMQDKVHDEVQFLQCENCDNVQFSLQNLESLTQGRKLKNLVTDLLIRKQEEEDLKASA